MSGKKILVADDEAHILHVVSMKLRNAGFEVITAVDGEEALELCTAEKPDLLITDYQMPLMTGLELCTLLRGQDADAGHSRDHADRARLRHRTGGDGGCPDIRRPGQAVLPPGGPSEG